MKKRILWVSEYCLNTGFSRVSESLIKQLASEFDITVLDVYRAIQGKYSVTFSPTPETKVDIIGKDSHGSWSASTIITEMQKYDCIFILQDIWNTAKILKAVKASGKSAPPIVIYFPVDAADHNTEWYEDLDIVSHAVTYTEFARAEVYKCIDEMVGLTTAKFLKSKVHIIPHGIDYGVFFDMKTNKHELRQHIYGTDKYNDHFIFLNANRNQPRKRLDITLLAFKIFLETYRYENSKPAQAILHMHCGNTDDRHINVMKLATRYGIAENISISNTGHGLPNWREANMNALYNSCDAGVNTSIGEGWGLCNTEHASIGRPQIVPAHSACKELFADVGLLATAESSYIQGEIMTTGKIVDEYEFADKMLNLYSDSECYTRLSELSKNKFASEKYSWKYISEMWKTIFQSI